MSDLKKPESLSREHRLGLVVYGGISLAIYMNGICQEFYNAVRGRGIYKLVKAFTDADIVVDIISGTSAGGINGVLLSFALANNSKRRCIEFKKFAEIWKKSGDIRKLLFQEEYDGIEKASFFNGKGYHRAQINNSLRKVWNTSEERTDNQDWFSEFGELDLFVTGTDVLGKIYKIFDNTGNAIEVKDHHAVFHLKYRDFGNNPFEPGYEPSNTSSSNGEKLKDQEADTVIDALAKLCQITSCFPMAFPPVTVRLDTEKNREDSEEEAQEKRVDKKLAEWGNLKKNRLLSCHKPSANFQKIDERAREIDDDPGYGPRLHFVDGGVLDNRPFSYTIKEIYYRTAERPVSRKLFYIDPSPERLTNNSNYKEMHKPSAFKVVKESLIGMPRYESINNDLEMIKEHNEKVRRYNFLQADVEELLDSRPLQDQQNQDVADQQRYVCLRARLINIKDKLLPLIYLKSDKEDRTNVVETVAQILANSLSTPREYSQRLRLLKQLEKDVLNFDVEYALRKQFFITNYVFKLLDRNYLCTWISNKKNHSSVTDFIPKENFIPEDTIDQLVDYLKQLIRDLNYHIKILEIVQEKLYQFFSCNEVEDYFVDLLEDLKTRGEERLSRKFPEDFYKSMLKFYKRFLNVDLPEDFLELSENFTADQVEDKLNLLKKILDDKSASLQSSLKTANSGEGEHQPKDKVELTNCILSRLATKTRDLLGQAKEDVKDLNLLVGKDGKLFIYFNEFERIDAYLFPLDYLAGVPEKQLIETYRISPEDAKLGLSAKIPDGERLEHKLAGNSLNAFGGFFKESWRANDILWGRLDGVNRIVEALVTEKSIKNFLDFLRREANIKAGFGKYFPGQQDVDFKENFDSYLDQLLNDAIALEPSKGKKMEVEIENEAYLAEYRVLIKDQLKRIIKNIEENNPETWSQAKGKKQSPEEQERLRIELQDIIDKELVPTLISVGHLIILAEEFPSVIKTSIQEQFGWRQHKVQDSARSLLSKLKRSVQPNQPQTTAQFLPIEGGFSTVLSELAIVNLARESLSSMSLKEMEEFFYQGHLDGGYRISSETLTDIPKSERKKIAFRFVRIFQDIFTTWRRKSSRIRSTWLNRVLLSIFAGFISCVLRILVRFI